MFSHRGLFLAVTISLASIALAGVLVQPGYEHEYDSNPRYLQHQSVSQHWIPSLIEQYRAEQLPDQESTRYLPGVQTTEKNEDPKEMIYNRMIKSRRSDPASTESSKSKIVAHDNDVAAKSPLTDVKHPTTIGSLLSESVLFLSKYPSIRELSKYNLILCIAPFLSSTISSRNITFPRDDPTDTNDKRVENCQIEKNFMLSIFTFLGSTISSTNITLSEHEPTDTNDKRVENCEIKYNFILCIAPFVNSTISSANIRFRGTVIHILPFLGVNN